MSCNHNQLTLTRRTAEIMCQECGQLWVKQKDRKYGYYWLKGHRIAQYQQLAETKEGQTMSMEMQIFKKGRSAWLARIFNEFAADWVGTGFALVM